MDPQLKDSSRKYSAGSPSPSVNAPNRSRDPQEFHGNKTQPQKPAQAAPNPGPSVRNNLSSPELSANTSQHGSSSKLLPVVTNLPEEREFFAAVKSQLISRVGEKIRDTESMLKNSFSKLEAREKEIIKHYESQLSTSRQITNQLVGLSRLVGTPVAARQLTRREEGLVAISQKHYIARLLKKGLQGLGDYTEKRREYKIQSEQNQVLASLSENYNQHIDRLEAEIAEMKKEIARTKKEKMRYKDTVRAALESGFSLLESSGKKGDDQSEFEEENPRGVTPTEYVSTSAYKSSGGPGRNEAEPKHTSSREYSTPQQGPQTTGAEQPYSTASSQGRSRRGVGLNK